MPRMRGPQGVHDSHWAGLAGGVRFQSVKPTPRLDSRTEHLSRGVCVSAWCLLPWPPLGRRSQPGLWAPGLFLLLETNTAAADGRYWLSRAVLQTYRVPLALCRKQSDPLFPSWRVPLSSSCVHRCVRHGHMAPSLLLSRLQALETVPGLRGGGTLSRKPASLPRLRVPAGVGAPLSECPTVSPGLPRGPPNHETQPKALCRAHPVPSFILPGE